MPNKQCVDHDGDTFNVFSDDVLVLQTPLGEGVGDPASMVGIDASTGLPATYPAPTGHDARLPSGLERGDLLWWDGTAWQLLRPDNVDGQVLTEVRVAGESGEVTDLQWLPPFLPSVTPRTQQCGMALRLSEQLRQAYNWLATEALNALNVALNTEGGLSGAITLLATFFTGPYSVLVNAANNVTSNWSDADYINAAQQLAPFTPGQCDGITNAIYCALRSFGDSLTLTTDTITAIKVELDSYPDWLSPQQPAILGLALDSLPLVAWQNWATQGSRSPSLMCDDYSCGE